LILELVVDKIHIPLSFEQTISAVLKVKPPAREKPKRKPKAGAKRPGRKPKTMRVR